MRFQGKTCGLTVCSSTQFVAHIGQERTNAPCTFVTINRGSLCSVIKAASSASKRIAGAGCPKARADSTADQSLEYNLLQYFGLQFSWQGIVPLRTLQQTHSSGDNGKTETYVSNQSIHVHAEAFVSSIAAANKRKRRH